MAARHSVNGKSVRIPMDAGTNRSKTHAGSGMGATPHSDLVAYAKGTHVKKTPKRGTTRTLSR